MATLKTTVYLDREDYQRLKAIAAESGETPAAMVREAVARYVRERATKHRLPRSIGAGHSGRRDLGARSEDLLRGFGRK